MKDPSNKVAQAVYALLNNNVTVSGITWPVYQVVPDSVDAGYVYIGDFQYSDDSTKDRFLSSCNLQVQVVNYQLDQGGSAKFFKDMVSKVQELIKPSVTSILDLSPTFNNTYLYTQNVIDAGGFFPNGNEQRAVITFNLEIEQL